MVINALSFIVFMALISTGWMMKFTLPRGSGAGVGKGFGYGKQVVTVFDMDRHEWGEIHFWISVTFIALLALHLILHRRWLLCIAWGIKEAPQSIPRRILTLGIIAFMVIALAFPWIAPRVIE